MAHRILKSEADLASFVRFLGNLALPITVEWVQGRDRTREQNALQWMWASEVAQQLQDRTASRQQAEWKLRLGVPILRRDSTEFRAIYDRLLRPLSYEEKVDAMEHLGISVTSMMKVRQMVEFLDGVERDCREMGLQLTPPDPELSKYHARYRRKDAA